MKKMVVTLITFSGINSWRDVWEAHFWADRVACIATRPTFRLNGQKVAKLPPQIAADLFHRLPATECGWRYF